MAILLQMLPQCWQSNYLQATGHRQDGQVATPQDGFTQPATQPYLVIHLLQWLVIFIG